MARPLNGVVGKTATERERRDQEVLRAKRELAAYFKGRRTEREARAALRIIKAFVRDREREDPRSLRPLPGIKSTMVAKRMTTRKIETVRKRVRRKAHRQLQGTALEGRHDTESQSPANETLPPKGST